MSDTLQTIINFIGKKPDVPDPIPDPQNIDPAAATGDIGFAIIALIVAAIAGILLFLYFRNGKNFAKNFAKKI